MVPVSVYHQLDATLSGELSEWDNDSERHVSFQGAHLLHYIGKLALFLSQTFGFDPTPPVNHVVCGNIQLSDRSKRLSQNGEVKKAKSKRRLSQNG